MFQCKSVVTVFFCGLSKFVELVCHVALDKDTLYLFKLLSATILFHVKVGNTFVLSKCREGRNTGMAVPSALNERNRSGPSCPGQAAVPVSVCWDVKQRVRAKVWCDVWTEKATGLKNREVEQVRAFTAAEEETTEGKNCFSVMFWGTARAGRWTSGTGAVPASSPTSRGASARSRGLSGLHGPALLDPAAASARWRRRGLLWPRSRRFPPGGAAPGREPPPPVPPLPAHRRPVPPSCPRPLLLLLLVLLRPLLPARSRSPGPFPRRGPSARPWPPRRRARGWRRRSSGAAPSASGSGSPSSSSSSRPSSSLTVRGGAGRAEAEGRPPGLPGRCRRGCAGGGPAPAAGGDWGARGAPGAVRSPPAALLQPSCSGSCVALCRRVRAEPSVPRLPALRDEAALPHLVPRG